MEKLIEYLKANLRLELDSCEDRYGEIKLGVNLYLEDNLIASDSRIIKDGE